MGNTGVIDSFLGVFTSYIDSGFGLLSGEVAFVATTLIVIDVTLAALFWAWGADEDIIARLVKKTLFVGVFAYIIGNWNNLARIVFESFAGLGLMASGTGFSVTDLMRPGRVAQTGLDAGRPLLESISDLMGWIAFFENFIQIACLLFAWALVVLAFFILAIQLFVTLLEFKLTTLAGFVLIPFGLFGKTAFMAEKVLGNVVSSGIKVLVLTVIIGIGSTLFSQFTAGFGGATALAAGCSCILKPSEITPMASVALVQAFHDAGLPAGVLNLVMGHPGPITDFLLAHEAVRAVTFTGSVPVGRMIAGQAGRLMKPALMELGGHAPVIVFDDVDVEKIATAAVAAKYRNAGQICTCPTRFFVQDRIYDAFVGAFARHAGSLRLAGRAEGDGVMGPVVSAHRRAALCELIDDACRHGARLMTGGRPVAGRGSFLEPTVLADVPPAAMIMEEEPFGPVAVFNRFTDLGDVLHRANRLPFGLAAYLFTRDIGSAHAVAHGLECGIVGVNTFAGAHAETPFGGNKDSGHGREGGTEGIRELMTLKFIVEGTL